MPKLRTALALRPRDWLAFLDAMLCMAWARLLVTVVPLRHWRRQIADRAAREARSHPLSEAETETALVVARAVRRVSRNAPIELLCLPQALSARWMLARRGIATELYIGTRRDGGEQHRFHAWLKAGDFWVTGHCKESEYSVFSRGSLPGR